MTRGPDKQFDREAVLQSAMDLFWRHGYQGVGMAALLEGMGIGRQSLYNTFGDKRQLFLEALASYARQRMAPMLDTLRAPGSPMANLGRVLGQMKQLALEHGGEGCMVGNTLAEFGAGDPDVARLLASCLGQIEDAFCEVLTRARDAGELVSELTPRDLARMLVTMTQGAALTQKIRPDTEALESVVRAIAALLGLKPHEESS